MSSRQESRNVLGLVRKESMAERMNEFGIQMAR